MKDKKKILIIIVTILVVLAAGAFSYLKIQTSPVTSTSSQVDFVIEENTSTKTVFKNLKEQGIIKDDTISYYYSRLFHKPNFKAGKYVVDPSWSLDNLIDHLSDDKNAILNTVTITFKEGEWLKDYAKKISEKTNLKYDEILNYWNNSDVFKMYQKEYPFLTDEALNSEGTRFLMEGYLFPDTYEFYKETDLDTVTRKFLDETLYVYNELKDQFDKSELSIHQVFTLASIVQAETGNVEDMPTVAGVYMNRIRADYPIQSSVTMCYAIDLDESDDWRKCEYSNDFESPYNTMEKAGLPPSPIMNPGIDAIKAALNPADTDYLFFIGDACNGTGKTFFSKTYAEHQQLIKEHLPCLQ